MGCSLPVAAFLEPPQNERQTYNNHAEQRVSLLLAERVGGLVTRYIFGPPAFFREDFTSLFDKLCLCKRFL